MMSLALLMSVGNADAAIVINEILADPGTLAGDSNCDGIIDTVQDEFVELVNTGPNAVDLTDWTINDAIGLKHTFPGGTTLAAGQAVVVWGGGTPTMTANQPAIGAWCKNLAGVRLQTASSGTLALNNSGDTVTLFNATGTQVAQYVYGAEANTDQSINRDPDLSANAMVGHSTLSSTGQTWSPGTSVAGQVYSGGGAVSPTLSAANPGTAGGNNTWTLTNGTANTAYVLIASLTPGNFTHPTLCTNVSASMSNPTVYAQAVTNGNGTAAFTVAVPGAAAGRRVYVQAASPSACNITNLVTTQF
ncbi:MAG: lamin tail domain-containing protein [Alphaproteobacteria bacterium]|nr:lamin tail domain-containing protein [Alphaproteobacteria bacterium]MCB9697370.1 lamin tail domain-containing protein [Alphaproteobacteria bacterium]